MVKQTKVQKESTLATKWNEDFTFTVAPASTSGQSQLKLTVLDKDTLSEDIVGTSALFLEPLLVPPLDKWVQLTHKNSPAGELHINVQFTPNPAYTNIVISETQ